jgi:hypothetical protein
VNNQSLKRKYFVIGIISIIGAAWLASANIAQGATVEELLAQIADLKAQIATLQEQLAELQPPAGVYEGIPAGFSFENNLKYGMKNNEVKYLQIILKVEVGPPTYPETVPATGWFGPVTKASVIKFQEKYASEILAPWGFAKGTGFVGRTTRAKLNNLLKVTPPPFDFSLSAIPSAGSVEQGKLISATINVSLISGTAQSISFSASGLPSGASASFSPTSCNPTCSSTMTIATSSATPTGTYPIAITGTGGGLTKTTNYSLAITTPPTLSVALSADPVSGIAPLSVNLTAQVSGITTGPINYTFYCNRSDSGTNITPDYDHKKDGISTNPYTTIDVCHYGTAGTYTAKVIAERGTLAAENRVTISVNPPFSGEIDLDVTYIERTPRHYRYRVTYFADRRACEPEYINYYPYADDRGPQLCPNETGKKRWPDIGETIAYTAHLINKGKKSVGGFDYKWIVNGIVVASGSSSALGPAQETTITYTTTWPSSPETIQLKVDPNNVINETVETNNDLTINSHDLTISYWVEQGIYDIFNARKNLVGSYSFEDWLQAHFAKMNERFSQAQYSVAPKGILNRIRIDKIVVVPFNPDNLNNWRTYMANDPLFWLVDGRWLTVADKPTLQEKQQDWNNYVNNHIGHIDWGLIHELAHQLGVIDLYRMNLANDPENNNRFQVKDLNGRVIPASELPTYAWSQILFKHPGLMGGGDTSPYNDGTYFESHTAAGMNSHYNHRRGYYGEYLFDTPVNNYLKILDSQGNPLVGAQVALYQKDAITEYFDNTPEITGTTNGQGIISLPNRPVKGVTTATGHTLKNNPFGQINVVGTNGTMFVKVTKGAQESYRWLLLHDLNLAYWSGKTDSATYIIKTNLNDKILTK